MKTNTKKFGYKKLLLGLFLLLQIGFVGSAIAAEKTQQQMIDEENADFDLSNDEQSEFGGDLSGLRAEERAINEEQKRIDSISDPTTKKAEQEKLNERNKNYLIKKDERDALVGECNPRPGEYCVKIDSFQKGGEVIRGKNGIELISNYIGVIYKVAAGIIGVIAVLIVVISGIQISIGGLSPEGVNQARDRILQALLSLALLFGTALILQTVNPGFFVSGEDAKTAMLILHTLV